MCRTNNGTLSSSNINWRLSIQNHLKPSITAKRRNNAKHLTWNSIRLKFMKISIPDPVKSLGYMKCCSLSSSRRIKSSSNSISYNCHKVCSWSRRPKTILEILHFSRWSTVLLFTSFSKTLLTTERRLMKQ